VRSLAHAAAGMSVRIKGSDESPYAGSAMCAIPVFRRQRQGKSPWSDNARVDAGVVRFGTKKHYTAAPSSPARTRCAPSTASTRITSLGVKWPDKTSLVKGFSICCWITADSYHCDEKASRRRELPGFHVLLTMQYMKAALIYDQTETRANGVKLEMVIWQLPAATADRPHGIKYRLWAGRDGQTLVRYDNERCKGDHKHLGAVEMPYVWRGMSQLVADFIADVEALK